MFMLLQKGYVLGERRAKNTPSAGRCARCVQNRSSLCVVFFLFQWNTHQPKGLFSCLPKVHLTFLKGEHTRSGLASHVAPSRCCLWGRELVNRGAEIGDIPL